MYSPLWDILRMEVAVSSETLLPIYQITHHTFHKAVISCLPVVVIHLHDASYSENWSFC
jgi:hypothetical protein